MTALNATHDPKLRSWVASANEAGNDFPIQNLPFGRFRAAGSSEAFRIGVAIGDQVLDLRATGLVDTDDMNVLMNASVKDRQALRAAISAGLAEGSDKQAAWSKALLAQAKAEMTVPCRIGDYTDFYTGIHHATTIGKLFRPDQPLMPNYKWVPIGYHGRASSIGISGQSFKRPQGQTKAPDAETPSFGPCKRLDYELELGFLVGQGNAQGEPIAIGEAEDHLFGVTLLNDWSARDIQAWEYQPLGPFLSKNFASTLSPWIVTSAIKTVPDLIAAARKNPGMPYATAGAGTSMNLAGVMFAQMTGTELVHVAYKGSGPAITDMLGNNIGVMFDNLPASLPHIQAGKLRALAVAGPARSPSLPDVPTMAEAGLKGYALEPWFGVYGPANLPAPVVKALNEAFVEALAMPDVKAKLAQAGFSPRGSTPQELAKLSDTEYKRLGEVAKKAGMSAD